EKFPEVPVIGLTATATPKVKEDTIKLLNLRSPSVYMASFNRSNLSYEIRQKKNSFGDLVNLLKSHDGESGIIYCNSRKSVESLSRKLNNAGFHTLPYHAGLSDSKRHEHQERFIKDDVDIIVATVAFGMGIDKPNVRFVVHYDLPKNIEGYYQETGRGGRDGLECECVLYFSRGDWYKIKYFIDKMSKKSERDIATVKLREMIDFCESTTCRRKVLLGYFGEDLGSDYCGGCDVCLRPRDTFDASEAARVLLSCVDEVNERFGLTHVVDIISGSRSKKIKGYKHDRLTSYGTGEGYTKSEWLDIAREMVRLGFLDVKGARYPLLSLNKKSRGVLAGDEVLLTRPASGTVAVKTGKPQNTTSRSATSKSTSSNNVRSSTSVSKTASSRPSTSKKTKSKGTASKASTAIKKSKRVPTPISRPDKKLFDRLKKLRKSLAEEEDVPPYIIFADTSLRQMAVKYPIRNEEFLDITGVGEFKLKKYGPVFMEEITRYLKGSK
ncbi:MAG: RecQ family ATP-dependent DNA helicase, partial [Halobacteriota archaeon]